MMIASLFERIYPFGLQMLKSSSEANDENKKKKKLMFFLANH